jgi:LAS superfamily LD-carboxypeptidase LdcB
MKEREMEIAPAKPTDEKPQLASPLSAKRGRRSRQAEVVARFFLAKEGTSPTKPELGQEAQNESDALIKAFQSKGGVIYVVTAYRAEAEVQGGNPILVKRPLEK